MFKPLYGLVFVAAFSGMGVVAQPEIKGSPEELRQFLHPRDNTVSLTGQAEKTAYSDKAIIELMVTTESKTLSKSIEDNNAVRQTLVKALIAGGIAADEINNAKFSSSPQYGWFGSKPDSFEVNNRVSVGVTSEAHFLLVSKLADAQKEINVVNTRFEHTKKDELKNEVRKMAMDKILEQKAFYEKSLNVKLVAIAFNDGDVGFTGMRQERAMAPAKVKLQSLAEHDTAAPTQSTGFDEVKYHANIYVQYVVASESK